MIRRLLLLVTLVASLTVVATAVVVLVSGDTEPGPGRDSPVPTAAPPPPRPAEPPETQPTASAPTIAPCAAPDPARLRVVTVNLHFGRDREGDLDLARVAEELDAWDADVVLLQEVDRDRFRSGRVDQARRLGRALDLEVVLGLNRKVPPGASGNAILSRHPVVGSDNIALPGRQGEIARGLLRATLDVDGERVAVFVTHLESSSPGTRVTQSRAVVRHVLKSRHPVVLGGDLNSGPGRPPVRRIVRAGLVDAWEAAGRGDGGTVPAAAPRRRIDYVFADESFRVRSAEVLVSLVSDHRAVRADLVLLPEGCR